MQHRNIRKKFHPKRGSAIMELAVLLPLLISSALLAMDYGRFATRFIAVTNAARAGAYMGSFNPPDTNQILWDAAIVQAVANELSNNVWFDPNQLTVTDPTLLNQGGGVKLVRVEVVYPFQTVVNWSYLTGYSNQRDLRRIVVMRAIR